MYFFNRSKKCYFRGFFYGLFPFFFVFVSAYVYLKEFGVLWCKWKLWIRAVQNRRVFENPKSTLLFSFTWKKKKNWSFSENVLPELPKYAFFLSDQKNIQYLFDFRKLDGFRKLLSRAFICAIERRKKFIKNFSFWIFSKKKSTQPGKKRGFWSGIKKFFPYIYI